MPRPAWNALALCAILITFPLAGCGLTGHVPAFPVSTPNQGPPGNGFTQSHRTNTILFSGRSNHWFAVYQVPAAQGNGSQTVFTLKYRGTNTPGAVTWQMRTPTVSISGGGVVGQGGELTGTGSISLPSTAAPITVTVRWNGKTQTFRLVHP